MRRLIGPVILVTLGCAAVVGCDKKDGLDKERGAAPPPVASSKPGACASGGGKVTDSTSAAFFPPRCRWILRRSKR